MSLAKTREVSVPNDLESFWIPFTPNRAFKKSPRLIARAKDMHYYTPDGRAAIEAARPRVRNAHAVRALGFIAWAKSLAKAAQTYWPQ